MKARHTVLHSFGEDLEPLPSFLWVLVCKGQDVWRSPAAVADHHRERGVLPQTLQDNGDHIGTSFYYEPNYRNTLPQSCKNQKNRNKKKKRSVIETYWETEISGCDFCVRALLQTRALRKNDGHFMANVSKTIHMLLPKPKRKRVRCLSALAFVSAPYW